MSSFIAFHPFKAVYSLLAFAFEGARLPLWLVIYTIPSMRPCPRWTYSQAIKTRMLKAFLHHACLVRVQMPLSLQPGSEGSRFITIDPQKWIERNLYAGILEDGDVKPTTIGGTWYREPPTATIKDAEDVVILHVHGGAFVIGDGRKHDCGFLASTLLRHSGVAPLRILCPQYRLAGSPTAARFPAQLQDVLTTYLYLLEDLQITASRIVISGDSAGGNIVLQFLRWMSEHGSAKGIPPPAAALLWSPWVRVSAGADESDMLRNPNHQTDFLPAKFGSWGACAVCSSASQPFERPASQERLNSAYLTPLHHPFRTAVPLFIQTGGAEILYKEDMEIAQEMREAGNNVEVHVVPDAPHDILLLGKAIAWEDGARRCAQKAGEFLKGLGIGS